MTKTNLFKHQEIAARFKIPSCNTARWCKASDWRFELYRELEKVYAKELAEKASKIGG